MSTDALGELVAMHNADMRRLQKTINTLIVTGNVMSARLSVHIANSPAVSPIDSIAIAGWNEII